jgi:hypothetical protein
MAWKYAPGFQPGGPVRQAGNLALGPAAPGNPISAETLGETLATVPELVTHGVTMPKSREGKILGGIVPPKAQQALRYGVAVPEITGSPAADRVLAPGTAPLPEAARSALRGGIAANDRYAKALAKAAPVAAEVGRRVDAAERVLGLPGVRLGEAAANALKKEEPKKEEPRPIIRRLEPEAAPPAPSPSQGAPVPPGEAAQTFLNPYSLMSQGGPRQVGAAETPLVAPGRQAKIAQDVGDERQQLGELGEAKQREGSAATTEIEARARALEGRAEEEKRLGNEALTSRTAQRDKEQAAIDEYKAQADKRDAFSQHVYETMKTDPDRFWKNASGADKMRYGLAMGIGAIAAGFSGQGNKALEAVRGHIADDVAAQKSDYEHAETRYKQMGDRVEASKNLYAMARQTGLDDQGAREFATNVLLKGAASQAEGMAERAKSPSAIAAANTAAKALGVESAERQTKLDEKLASMNRYVPAHVEGGPSGPTRKEVAEAALKIREQAAQAGTPISVEESLRQAFQTYTGVNTGSGPSVNFAKEPKEATEGKSREEERQREITQLASNQGEVDRFRANVGKISPSLVQGVSPSERGKRKQLQDEYNAFVIRTVAEDFKRATGNVEPKNPNLIHELAQPFLVEAGASNWEPEEVTAQRMDALKKSMAQSNAGLRALEGRKITEEEFKGAAPAWYRPR